MKLARQEFPARVRREAYVRANGKCEKCNKPFTKENPADFHHIVAAMEGGSGSIENCHVLGYSCCHNPGGRVAKRRLDNPLLKAFQMRADDDFLEMVDEWRRMEPDLPSRAEAIRRLVTIAVEIKKKAGKK